MVEKKHRVGFVRIHRVQFSVKYESTILIIREEFKHDRKDRKILANEWWEQENDQMYGPNSFFEISHDGVFDEEELMHTRDNLQLLEDAYDAMTKGTKAA